MADTVPTGPMQDEAREFMRGGYHERMKPEPMPAVRPQTPLDIVREYQRNPPRMDNMVHPAYGPTTRRRLG